MKHHVKKGKRALLFSFLIFSVMFKSQAFIRSSDGKTFDSVILVHAGENMEINKSNYKDFPFNSEDKILYNNKHLDFYISQDTLIFFDRIKDIEEVHFTNENFSNKKEKTVKSRELKNNIAAIFPNNLTGTYIKINTSKRTFVKSIVFFPELLFSSHDIKGDIHIQILNNINGFPDSNNPILSFQKDISETVNKQWEIVLPKIIKYPESGFFVTFNYQSEDKSRTATLKLNKDTYMYRFYPNTEEWKKSSVNGYLYKLKVLQ